MIITRYICASAGASTCVCDRLCMFLQCYLHRKLQLAFSTPNLVYDAVVFFLLFHRFSVVVGCGIWLLLFTFQKFWANVHVTMKFLIQYNEIQNTKNFELFQQVFLIKQT